MKSSSPRSRNYAASRLVTLRPRQRPNALFAGAHWLPLHQHPRLQQPHATPTQANLPAWCTVWLAWPATRAHRLACVAACVSPGLPHARASAHAPLQLSRRRSVPHASAHCIAARRRSLLIEKCPGCVSCPPGLGSASCCLAFGACGCVYHNHCLSPWLEKRWVCPVDEVSWVAAAPRLDCAGIAGRPNR